ncbi:MAG TPA: hypothetical protein VFU49_09830, partial [Ktedonobacteraceae bacterium]|nr:hypothetical protein [Ktedonobacteraceae bacterium]
MKFSNDEPFQENLLEEQLDVLAQAEGQILASPESLAYHRLKQFHAVWAREEAQAIERVRQKLTSHASSSEHQLDNQASPKLPPVPLSATHSHSVRPAQRLSRIANALAAVLIVSLLVSGFVLLLHSRQPSTSGDSVAHAWHQIASPNLPGDNSLSSVSAATGNDAWAVGTAQIEQSSATNDTPPPVPLIEH